MNKKRIAAIIALLLIAGLYAATAICALLDSPLAKSCLAAALFCTISGPVTIYAYMMAVRYLTDRRK